VKDIKVLGPGCPRCEELARLTKKAADELGIEYQFEKVKDINEFPRYGVMLTPGLVVDGAVKIQGKVPSVDELKDMIR
jgi:small redox-active disulfide protein 2